MALSTDPSSPFYRGDEEERFFAHTTIHPDDDEGGPIVLEMGALAGVRNMLDRLNSAGKLPNDDDMLLVRSGIRQVAGCLEDFRKAVEDADLPIEVLGLD